jgi:phosphoglycerate kinase
MKFLKDLDIAKKKVVMRADLDVPLDENLEITDDHRLQAAIPSIRYIIDNGASLVLLGHLGRPKGEVNKRLSLAPVAKRLSELLDREIAFCEELTGENTIDRAKSLSPGDILLVENVRFHPGESSNDPTLAEQLAKLGDVYVNNAFATAHRAHASTHGIAKHFVEKGAGLTIQNELAAFSQAFEKPERPLVVIFGGVKISTKMKALRNVAESADVILVGGAMANTMLVARGHNVGKSLYEEDMVETAKEAIAQMESRNCKLLLPVDVVSAAELSAAADKKVVTVSAIEETSMALDIGPETAKLFAAEVASAKTVVWNGPLGAFEVEGFNQGTFSMVDALCETSAHTVVGGGDTDLALHLKQAVDKMDYVSTAGGAFLTLLEGSKLIALEALE